MKHSTHTTPGLDSFWEDADYNESSEHPLERELGDRLDALARYQRLIEEAEDNGRDDAAQYLLDQHERAEQEVQRIAQVVRRLRENGSAGQEQTR